jgi:hypothetical protein
VYGVGSVGREAVGDVWRVDVRTYVLSYAAEDVCNHSVEEPAVSTRIRQHTSAYVRIRQDTSGYITISTYLYIHKFIHHLGYVRIRQDTT